MVFLHVLNSILPSCFYLAYIATLSRQWISRSTLVFRLTHTLSSGSINSRIANVILLVPHFRASPLNALHSVHKQKTSTKNMYPCLSYNVWTYDETPHIDTRESTYQWNGIILHRLHRIGRLYFESRRNYIFKQRNYVTLRTVLSLVEDFWHKQEPCFWNWKNLEFQCLRC